MPAADPATLADELAEVQVQTERQMRAYNDLITDALRHIR
jgi:hypothetical protein